jgi:signal transduction histidine kinase
VVAHRADGDAGQRRVRVATPDQYAGLPIPTSREVTLGFAFAQPIDAATLAERMPANLARHAAVALSLVTEAMGTDRELAALRAAEEQRSRFVSTVAHELRTPLTGLSGYLDLILDGKVDDPAVEREFLERGRNIVGSMTALVGDLLERSRLESGSLELEAEPFSVAEALEAVAESLLPIALDTGVHLESVLPPRIRTAIGDRRRVDQIVTNLAANALKYGADGGLVELAGRFEGTHAIVAVRDEGPGIEAEDRSRIFEPFYRMVDHARVTGTGLGLSIARDLARAMGGDLDVASLPGTGSSFVLVLPGVGARRRGSCDGRCRGRVVRDGPPRGAGGGPRNGASRQGSERPRCDRPAAPGLGDVGRDPALSRGRRPVLIHDSEARWGVGG